MLNEAYEVNLAKTADVNQLKDYLKHTWLCVNAQIELIARGNPELIKLYVSSYTLSDEALCELVKLGNKDLLLFVSDKVKISPCAFKLMVEMYVEKF